MSAPAMRVAPATGRKWKPYPAYKDSGIEWLGEIPAHWEVKRLKRLFRVINGSTPNSGIPEFWDGDIPWVTPEDLGQLETDTITRTSRQITESGYQSCGTTLVPPGSLVLSTRAPIGHLAISNMSLCTNQGCRSLIFRSDKDKRYFYYQLLTARSELQSWGQGSTFQELSKSKLGVVLLADPPLSEQRAIATFLDHETAKIDALIAKKERLIALLEERRTALISRAVTKGLDSHVPMKDSGVKWLGEIPAHWNVKRLKFVVSCKLQYGANASAEFDNPEWPRFIRITDIAQDGSLRPDTYKSLPEEIAFPYLLQDGDILFARSGATVGKTFQYRRLWGRACFAGYLILCRPKRRQIESDYLRYFTQSRAYESWKDSVFIQATIENISADKYNNLVIPLPGLSEQCAIITFLDRETTRIDAIIAKTREHIRRLQERRTALISAAVTGKIDVREASDA